MKRHRGKSNNGETAYLPPVGVIVLAVFAILIMCHPGVSKAAPAAKGADIMLIDWKFHPGDNPLWANATIEEDLGWKDVQVPGNIQGQKLSFKNEIGWYRAKLLVGWQYRSRSLSLILGRIRDADEVYVNGVKIGGEGRIGDGFIKAGDKVRVYPIPRDLIWYSFLRYDKQNTIAVRVMNVQFAGGIYSGPIAVGDYEENVLKAREMDTNLKIIQGATLSILVVISLFSAFLYLNGFRSPVNVYFGTFALTSAITIFLSSIISYDLGLLNSFSQRLVFALSGVLALLYSQFARATFHSRATIIDKILSGTVVIIGLTLLVILPYAIERWVLLIWYTLILLIFAIAAMRAVLAFRHHVQDSPILLGATIFPLIGCFLILLEANVPPGIDPLIYSVPVMAIPLLFAMAKRYQQMTRRLHDLSERIVAVQDIERAKFARDLHDGLGQSLAAIKLSLQMQQSKTADDWLNMIIGEVKHASTSLKDVVTNLRPIVESDTNLFRMIDQHARRTEKSVDKTIRVIKEGKAAINSRVAEQVFKVYQEALNNSIKHSGADRIEILLHRDPRLLRLSVHDDGVGFQLTNKKGYGLGLLTMEERASLLGGRIHVASEPMRGTTIELEVPLND